MKTYYSLYLAAFSSALLAAGSIYCVADILDVPVKILTRDPYMAAKVPPYFSYFSLLGSTIWLVSCTATLMTGIISWKIMRCKLSGASTYRTIVTGGLIGLIMALDDILLFHDGFARAVGIPEITFHLFYLISIGYMIIFSRKVIKMTPWIILFSSLACFGLSSIIDLCPFLQKYFDQSEDVFKFSAIVLWAFYFLNISWDFVKEHSPRVQHNSSI